MKYILGFFVSLAVLLLSPSVVYATEYYVSTTGSDTNPGTLLQPFKTIQKGADSANTPGDTVYIRGGTYKEQVTVKYSGSAGNFITFTAYNNESVVIDDTGLTAQIGSNGMFDIFGKSYIRVSNLQLINSPPTVYCANGATCADPNTHSPHVGIFVSNSNNILISHNKTQETYSSGIGVWLSQYVTVDGNTVINATNDHVPGLDWQTDQEELTIAQSSNFTVSHNYLSYTGRLDNHGLPYWGRVGGGGIDAKSGSSHGRIFGNTITNTRYRSSGSIYVDAWNQPVQDIEIFQNKIFFSNSGISIGSECGGTVDGVKIYNNIIAYSAQDGIQISNTDSQNGTSCTQPGNGPRKNIDIFHNTIYGTYLYGGLGSNDVLPTSGSGAGIYITTANIENIAIKNNLVAYGQINPDLYPQDPNNGDYGTRWVGQIVRRCYVDQNQITASNNLIINNSINPRLTVWSLPATATCSGTDAIELPGSTVANPNFSWDGTVKNVFTDDATIREILSQSNAGPGADFEKYFQLHSTSQAIDTGTSDLPQVYGTSDTLHPLQNDFPGNVRPQGLGYDIGAYEYVSGGTTPTGTPTPTLQPTQTPRVTPTPTPKPGDANGDGWVDGVDYVIWLTHYSQHIGGGASVGDFNGDGTVDGVDYVIWVTNYD